MRCWRNIVQWTMSLLEWMQERPTVDIWNTTWETKNLVWKTLNGIFMIFSLSHLHSRRMVLSDEWVWICSNTMQTFPVYEALDIEEKRHKNRSNFDVWRYQVRLGFTCIFKKFSVLLIPSLKARDQGTNLLMSMCFLICKCPQSFP